MKRLIFRLLVIAMAIVGLTAIVAVATGQGTISDPLVSLSYLQETFTDSLMKKLQTKVDETADELSQAMEEQIDEISTSVQQQMTQALPNALGDEGLSFEESSLTAGQTLELTAGAQLMPMSGELRAEADGLFDLTAECAAPAGTILSANHLYSCESDMTVSAVSDATLMLRQ